MFISNYDHTEIINVKHIIKAYISAPMYNQKKWLVVCDLLMNGTAVLYKADTEDECLSFLCTMYNTY